MHSDFPLFSEKRRVVMEYLCQHFPEHKLGEHYDCEIPAHVLRLSKKGERLVLMISKDFFFDHSKHEIGAELHRREVARALVKRRCLLLSKHGISNASSASRLVATP
jgi:hypothetical protein